MSEITIRDYQHEQDYAAMRANLRAADMFDHYYDAEPRVAAFVTRCPSNITVAEVDQQLVGSVILDDLGLIPTLRRLVVRDSHRRQGIAHMLVAAAEAKAISHGHPKLEAWVATVNTAGLEFWDARDYRGRPIPRINMLKHLTD